MRRFASFASGLFAVVAACGDDGGARKLPDAPPAPDDGPAPDMIAAGTVNVTTYVRFGAEPAMTPKAGIPVVAVNADGSLAGTATTDAQGKAALTIREGATVSAIYPEDLDNTTIVTSYVGVKPNDNLAFGDGYYDVPSANAGTAGAMTINWAAYEGATRYQVLTPCSNSYVDTLTFAESLQTYCQTPTAPIVVLALDANYYVIASAYLPDATYTVGSTVDVAAGAWVAQTANSYAVSFPNLPAFVAQLRFQARSLYPRLQYQSSDYVTPKAGVASTMLNVPNTAVSQVASAELGRTGNFGPQYYYKRGPSPLAFTLANVPWITDRAIVNTIPPYRALWLESAGTYDAAVLSLDWSRSDGKVSHYFQWNLILPPGVADFRLGTPPAALAELLPTENDFVNHELTLVDLSSAASYDAARALPEWRLVDPEGAVSAGDEPSAAVSSDGEGNVFVGRVPN